MPPWLSGYVDDETLGERPSIHAGLCIRLGRVSAVGWGITLRPHEPARLGTELDSKRLGRFPAVLVAPPGTQLVLSPPGRGGGLNVSPERPGVSPFS